MPIIYDVETPNGIGSLNPVWPTGTEPVSQGDNHLRLIKQAIEQSFPGFSAAGIGLGVALLKDPTYMNTLFAALITNVEGDIEVKRNLKAAGTATLGGNTTVAGTLDATGIIKSGGDVIGFGGTPASNDEIESQGGLQPFLHNMANRIDALEVEVRALKMKP